MSDTPKRQCFAVFAGQWNPERGFIPSIVTEGEAGHSPLIGSGEFSLPWFWGATLKVAKEVCAQENQRVFGLTPAEAREIVDSSITASISEDAARERTTERYDKALGRDRKRR